MRWTYFESFSHVPIQGVHFLSNSSFILDRQHHSSRTDLQQKSLSVWILIGGKYKDIIEVEYSFFLFSVYASELSIQDSILEDNMATLL